VSNPALKAVSRIHLQRVATPVPHTRSRAEALLLTLADTDARIGCAYRLLLADAMEPARLDRPAFIARAHALLLDLDLATQLVTALMPLKQNEDEWLHDRAKSIGDQRQKIEALMNVARE
jgi:hypothetical protein